MIDFGIISAGAGSRLKQDGVKLPKPLIEIEGEPMIGRLIKLMESSGASSVSVIINQEMMPVLDYLQSLTPKLNCELKISSLTTPSSMHSFYHLLQIMKPIGKFIVTTVDTIFRSMDFKRYVEFYRNSPHDLDGVMGVTTYIDDEKPLYVKTEDRYRIVGFSDTPFEGVKYVSAGIYGLQASTFPILEECLSQGVNRMRNFQRRLVEKGLNLDAYNLGKVIDADHLSDLEKVNALLNAK